MGDVSPRDALAIDAWAAAGDFQAADYPYWVSEAPWPLGCEDYCERCIDAAVARASVSGLWSDDPDLEHPTSDGGFPQLPQDSPPFCETCGALLRHTLTASGARQELDHFLEHGVRCRLDAWQLARAVEDAEEVSEEEIHILAAALRARAAEVADDR